MVRCGLEVQATGRRPSCWATLTYSDAHLPRTLQKFDLSAFHKRLRARLGDRRYRHFGCGEYGEQNGRPHYHTVLFGLGTEDEQVIRQAWGMGRVQVDRLEPAAIAYVAGYTAKNVGYPTKVQFEDDIDMETGEVRGRVIAYQPPFLLMSRRPGIGGDARKYWRSWRKTAIWDGKEVRVPRFLHEAYKKQATAAELELLKAEKDSYLAAVPLDAKLRERAGEVIANKRVAIKKERRSL